MSNAAIVAAYWLAPGEVIAQRAIAVSVAAMNAVGQLGSFVSPVLWGIAKDATGNYRLGISLRHVDQLRIAANLIHDSTGELLWAESYQLSNEIYQTTVARIVESVILKIEDHEIGWRQRRRAQRLGAGFGFLYGEAVELEAGAQEAPDLDLVVDDQHARRDFIHRYWPPVMQRRSRAAGGSRRWCRGQRRRFRLRPCRRSR